MSHLIVEYNEKYNFNKITCPEGHYITNWDGNDYKEYTASTIMYAPVTFVLDSYYCITEEEHNAHMVKHREAVEKEYNERGETPMASGITNNE